MELPQKTTITLRFLHKTVFFLFSFFIIVFLLFIIGNIQNFLDTTQLFILRIAAGTGGLLFFFAAFAAIFELYYIVQLRRKRYAGYCIINLIACATGLLGSVIATVILILSSGLFLK